MIKSLLSNCLFCLSVLFYSLFTGCSSDTSTARAYYLSPAGSDDNSGTIRNPWRSFERVNRMILKPGDTILLEGRSTFGGTLFMDSLDSGEKEGKILISSYGNGKAIIDGGKSQGIVVDNAIYFEISNIVVKGDGRKSGNMTDGVFITSSDSFKLDNIEVYGFQHSGIHVRNSKEARITRVNAHDNGFAGINVTGSRANDPESYENENLYIGYSIASNNPGDPTVLNNHSGNGILASSVRNGIIEYCEAFDNGWDMPWTGNGPVGIWVWDCTGITIQHCVSHDNKTNQKAGDGGGFDLDGGVSKSVIQYCLSWSNQGAGIGLFEFGAAKPWENNVIRYNISRNDGSKNGGSLEIWKGENGGIMKNCDIYNNTFYNDTARGIALSILNNVPGFSFRNNIFVYKSSFTGEKQRLTSESFLGNCYWNLSGNRSVTGYRNILDWANATGNEKSNGRLTGIFSDPLLVDPKKPINPDPEKMDEDNLSGFFLKDETLLAGKGVNPGESFGFNNPGIGIAGTQVRHDDKFDIGAVGFRRK